MKRISTPEFVFSYFRCHSLEPRTHVCPPTLLCVFVRVRLARSGSGVFFLSFFASHLRWRGSLAELMVKVDRSGNLREVLDIPSEMSESASASDGGNYAGGVSEVRGR